MPHEPDKSIGAEETFATDVDDPEVVRRELLRLSERTAARLRSSRQVGRTVSIKVRFADFTTITRSRTLSEGTDVSRHIYETARALFDNLGLERARLRLIGVRVEGIVPAETQTHQLLLGEREAGWREADRAVDRASRRFGASAPIRFRNGTSSILKIPVTARRTRDGRVWSFALPRATALVSFMYQEV